MTLLNVRNLGVMIHKTDVLRGINFDMAPGEIVAITGESGSGKSMTALSIMGLLPQGAQTSGTIDLMGDSLLTLKERDMCRLRGGRMGMVFQEPMTALNPVQNIGRQIEEHIYLHRPGHDARDTAIKLMKRVGLQDVPLTRYPHELSGGQRQRVVIAIAIACSPKLLIADEPTTALDVTTQAQILELLKRLAREDGMGLLMITHDLAVVAEMSDRILVMKDGEIVEDGPTWSLFRNMQHPYTKALFAASRHKVDLPALDPALLSRPLLQVQKAVRRYPVARRNLLGRRRRFEAVSDVTFTINAGERIGLVGESGCGKSTLTRAILGLERLQKGKILVWGKPLGKAERRKMQVVFQDPFGSFNPRHKVERLICEPFHLVKDAPLGLDRREIVAETLLAVGLTPEDAQKYPHQFSGGQRQRIAIARALITKPELVIFDEAVSALDVSIRAQILDLIAELCRSHNLTYLFISHDLSVVRSVTDRVLVMQGGKIVEAGPTEQVFNAPTHPYTQTLIAAAPRLPDVQDAAAQETPHEPDLV